ncbi:uncharacterized protein BJX67DRAFT_16799 [Aspergillus lucknowensis]|uniref:Uncharacterized protein n=1 Tax=Aspergillus lucknowensis TaxID=176173 RepID=A0ABR4M7Z7_9EURO
MFFSSECSRTLPCHGECEDACTTLEGSLRLFVQEGRWSGQSSKCRLEGSERRIEQRMVWPRGDLSPMKALLSQSSILVSCWTVDQIRMDQFILTQRVLLPAAVLTRDPASDPLPFILSPLLLDPLLLVSGWLLALVFSAVLDLHLGLFLSIYPFVCD